VLHVVFNMDVPAEKMIGAKKVRETPRVLMLFCITSVGKSVSKHQMTYLTRSLHEKDGAYSDKRNRCACVHVDQWVPRVPPSWLGARGDVFLCVPASPRFSRTWFQIMGCWHAPNFRFGLSSCDQRKRDIWAGVIIVIFCELKICPITSSMS